MQQENLTETVVSVVAPALVETPASTLAAAPDRSVPAAVPAVCVKIVTRLDALRQRMLDGMGAEQAEPILGDLRYVAEYTGLEDEIAMREDAAELAS